MTFEEQIQFIRYTENGSFDEAFLMLPSKTREMIMRYYALVYSGGMVDSAETGRQILKGGLSPAQINNMEELKGKMRKHENI